MAVSLIPLMQPDVTFGIDNARLLWGLASALVMYAVPAATATFFFLWAERHEEPGRAAPALPAPARREEPPARERLEPRGRKRAA